MMTVIPHSNPESCTNQQKVPGKVHALNISKALIELPKKHPFSFSTRPNAIAEKAFCRFD